MERSFTLKQTLRIDSGEKLKVKYLPVGPQLVPLHPVAVVERDGAVVRHGVEADLLSVQRVSYPYVFPPAEREDLHDTQTRVVIRRTAFSNI